MIVLDGEKKIDVSKRILLGYIFLDNNSFLIDLLSDYLSSDY